MVATTPGLRLYQPTDDTLRRPRVYIAGPISKGYLPHNLWQANRAFFELLRGGCAPLCPHWSVYAGSIQVTPGGSLVAVADVLPGGTTHEDWMGVDLPWVDVAEAVLRLSGESVGADAECARARENGTPVFHSTTEVIEWLRKRN